MTAASLIYIIGAGRSGSSLVGLLLGCIEGSVFVGELDRVRRHGGVPRFLSASGDSESVWKHVRSDLGPLVEPTDADRRFVEHPTSLFRLSRQAVRQRREYPSWNEALLEAVASAVDAEVIVDSSHHPLRRVRLEPYSGKIVTVHIVRNPHDVVRSFTDGAPPNKGVLGANVYLLVNDWLARAVTRRGRLSGEVLRARYEEIVTEPETFVASVATALQCSYRYEAELVPGPVFSANRIAQEGVVRIRPPASPVGKPRVHWLTRLLQYRSRRRYGYPS